MILFFIFYFVAWRYQLVQWSRNLWDLGRVGSLDAAWHYSFYFSIYLKFSLIYKEKKKEKKQNIFNKCALTYLFNSFVWNSQHWLHNIFIFQTPKSFPSWSQYCTPNESILTMFTCHFLWPFHSNEHIIIFVWIFKYLSHFTSILDFYRKDYDPQVFYPSAMTNTEIN